MKDGLVLKRSYNPKRGDLHFEYRVRNAPSVTSSSHVSCIKALKLLSINHSPGPPLVGETPFSCGSWGVIYDVLSSTQTRRVLTKAAAASWAIHEAQPLTGWWKDCSLQRGVSARWGGYVFGTTPRLFALVLTMALVCFGAAGVALLVEAWDRFARFVALAF